MALFARGLAKDGLSSHLMVFTISIVLHSSSSRVVCSVICSSSGGIWVGEAGGLEPKGGFGGGGGELDGEARGSGGLPHCAGGVLGGDDLSLQCWRP